MAACGEPPKDLTEFLGTRGLLVHMTLPAMGSEEFEKELGHYSAREFLQRIDERTARARAQVSE